MGKCGKPASIPLQRPLSPGAAWHGYVTSALGAGIPLREVQIMADTPTRG
jgi:hypothetical protein